LLATLGYNLLAPKYSQQDDSLSNSSQAEKNAAPDFTVQDASGKDVSLSDFKGEPIVLNFWASWCPPCKAECRITRKCTSNTVQRALFYDGKPRPTASGKRPTGRNSF
jgi:thiol-disulfide isomerase/thioredoxin